VYLLVLVCPLLCVMCVSVFMFVQVLELVMEVLKQFKLDAKDAR